MTDTTYNGWANFETWNVALWLQNDYSLYSVVKEWIDDRNLMGYETSSYETLRHTLTELFGDTTADGVNWNDTKICVEEIDEMIIDF